MNSITIISDNELIAEQLKIIENLIKNEINVKNIFIEKSVDDWINYELKPNFQILGPKFGKEINKIRKFLSELEDVQKRDLLNKTKFNIDNIEIDVSEIEVKLTAKTDNVNFEIVENFGLILDTEITNELNKERLSREIVSIIQQKRKLDGFEITDRVFVELLTTEKIIQNSIEDFSEYIKNETLATDLSIVNEVGSGKVLDYNLGINIKKSTKYS